MDIKANASLRPSFTDTDGSRVGMPETKQSRAAINESCSGIIGVWSLTQENIQLNRYFTFISLHLGTVKIICTFFSYIIGFSYRPTAGPLPKPHCPKWAVTNIYQLDYFLLTSLQQKR